MNASTSKPDAPYAAALFTAADLTPGARFLKADIHVHTPIDTRFKPRPQSKDKTARAELARSYLQAAKDRGIELLGVTEHNDVSWIDELRYAANGIGIYLLPGFEVESSEGIHVLCLFDPDTKVVDLEDTLARLGLTKEKRSKERRLEIRADHDLKDLVELIQVSCKGICVAAHMDSDKGLLTFGSGGARADRWKLEGLHAGQISRPPEKLHAGTRRIVENVDPAYQRERPRACLLASDARSIEEIGAKATWIKLDRIGVDGLRQAFLDPESRLSLEDPTKRRQGPRILAIAWEGGFLDGSAFPLNPELNALIGGKGTGKSTVIESIRYVFGLEARTEDVRTATRLLRENALKSGSKVSVLLDTGPPAPRRYIVERTAPHDPIVRDVSGEPCLNLDPQGLILPDVYGQKEVFEVAQNTQARLELLDTFAAEELRDVVERERELLRRAEANGSLILETRKRTDDAEAKLSELPNLEAWRARFREAGFEERLRERRLMDREQRLMDGFDKSLLEAERGLARIDAERPTSSLVDQLGDESFPDEDLLKRGSELLRSIEAQWSQALSALRKQLEGARRELAKIREEWEGRRAARAADFDSALRELQERMPDVDPERYLDVERRIEQLTPLGAAVEQLRERLDQALEERAKLLIELDDVRGSKHRIRLRAAERLTNATSASVNVELSHRADRDEFLERVTSLKTGARTDSLRRTIESDDFSPSAFTRYIREHALQGQYSLPDGQAALLERSIAEEALLQLDTVELRDRVSIGLDVGRAGVREYRPLEKLSPGQKSTAILLMIMQASDVPLLIDQPEDDLDNRFIYDDVVTRLRAEKPRRQFVVATHNANIPVLGDAEQIIVLDATDRGGRLTARGAIDNPDVRGAAELILEGGEEAFTRRQEKYGW
jgi:energy-coupling factor transporter ATP-binding protein EcfA2